MTSGFINLCLNSLDSEMLEELVLLYVNEKHHPEPEAQRIGVSGQAQHGVDVYAHVRDLGHMGYQSKAYAKSKLTTALLDKELELCHGFTPPLDYYAVVTLNNRDAKLQQHARDALLHGQANRVSIIALEDLASIVRSSPILKRQLYDFALHPSDAREISEYLAPVTGTTSSLSTQEIDQSLPDDLRTAEEWVNNGIPLRALAALDARQDRTLQQAVTRIRCRALYSLERYAEVLAIAQAEAGAQTPHAPIVILGALAAEELDKTKVADRLADFALDSATDATLADAVGGCIRLRAKRPGASMPALEAFAEERLGGGERVAVALADSAASIGDARRAAHWFRIARESRPSLALGVQINELATALIITTDESNEAELSRIIARLQQLLDSVKDPEAPSFRRVILTNLGAAYRAAGRSQDAALAWDEALAYKSGQRDIWIHRCLLCEHDNHVPPPDEHLAAMHATDPIAKLAYASALTSVNRLPEAKAIVDEVLLATDTTAAEASIAHVERLRIRLRTDDRQKVISDGLDYVTQFDDSLPMLGWLAMQHKHASHDNRRRIDDQLRQIDPMILSADAVLGIATPVAMSSSGTALGGWIPRLLKISFGEAGELINEHAASVLAEIQADTLDFAGCIATLEKARQTNTESGEVLVRLAQAYYEAGDRKKSLEILQEAIAAPDASALSVRNWAQLAVSLGQGREARKFLAALEKPNLKSPNDYIWLMQARVILGIKEDDADAVELLRNGLVTPERASQVFALGVNRRSHRPIEIVDRSTIVAIYIEGEVDDKFFISESGAPPLPGIRSLDPVNHPWIEQLIGQQSGAHVTLVGEPFDGKVAQIRSVSGVSDFLYAEAIRQIGLSSKEQTGVQRISGNLEFQMEEAKKLLAARHKEIEEHLDLATRGYFPASLMAKQFHASPREFLFKSKSWTPRSHSGSACDIEADESVMDKSKGWILDATTVLLLAMIGAEDFAGRLFKPPYITKIALAQLCDWRAEEREQRRAVGQMNLDDEGNLYLTSRTAADRVALLAFWKKVGRIINQCRIIDVPTIALSTEAAQILDALGPETLATFHAGKFHGLTLISEEFNARAFATASTGIPCVPLHAVIIEAYRRAWITPQQAMLWITRLIELGWTWVWFPTDWLWSCMRLPEEDSWKVLQALSSRMRLADPNTALRAVFTSLTLLDSGIVEISDPDRYRQVAVASFPKLDPAIRKKIVHAYKSRGIRSRGAEKTVKLLTEWAKDDRGSEQGA